MSNAKEMVAGIADTEIGKSVYFLMNSASSNLFGNSTPLHFMEAILFGNLNEIEAGSEQAAANVFSNNVKTLIALQQAVRYETVILTLKEQIEKGEKPQNINMKMVKVAGTQSLPPYLHYSHSQYQSYNITHALMDDLYTAVAVA